MIRTEKYMAFKRPEYREQCAGYDTIGQIIAQDKNGITVMFNGLYPEQCDPIDCLPIGNDNLRREFGLLPFTDVWSTDTPRSGVTIKLCRCNLPDHIHRPGKWPGDQ